MKTTCLFLSNLPIMHLLKTTLNNRTRNMANFFTNYVQSDCLQGRSRLSHSKSKSIAYPNPANHTVAFSNIAAGISLK